MFFSKYLVVKSIVVAKGKVKVGIGVYNIAKVGRKILLLLVRAGFKMSLANSSLPVDERF